MQHLQFEDTCCLCNEKVVFFLAAPELEGDPVLCSRCLFEKLTGQIHTWKGEVEC